MEAEFDGELWFWRGPAPWHFVSVPEQWSVELIDTAGELSYGWGMIPARVRIGATEYDTAMFRHDDEYVVPVKAAVRAAERVEVGDIVRVRLTV